jgi:hypothetical protein
VGLGRLSEAPDDLASWLEMAEARAYANMLRAEFRLGYLRLNWLPGA